MRTYICLQEADFHLVPIFAADEKGTKRLLIDTATPLNDKAHIPILLASEPDFIDGLHLGDIDLGSIPESEREMGIELLFTLKDDLKIHYATGGIHPKTGAFIFGSQVFSCLPNVDLEQDQIDWEEEAADIEFNSPVTEYNGFDSQMAEPSKNTSPLVLTLGILLYGGFLGSLIAYLVNETFGLGWF